MVWSAPEQAPALSKGKGKETTRMFGDYWTITEFDDKKIKFFEMTYTKKDDPKTKSN